MAWRKNTPNPRHGKNDANDPNAAPASGGFPRRTLILWLLLLAAVVMIFYPRLFGSSSANVKEFTQSEFEQLLESGRIRRATVVDRTSGLVFILEGEYLPDMLKRVDGTPVTEAGSIEDKSKNEWRQLKKYRTTVIYSDRLDSLISEKCGSLRIKISENYWLNILTSLLPFALLIVVMFLFSRRMFAGGAGEVMSFGKSRARKVLPGPDAVTLKDVAGIEEAKSEMQELVDYLKDPLKFRRLGGKIPRGVLMVGPPGTGKTLLARAIAGEAAVPFFSVSGSDFDEMFVGVGTSRVRDMFEEAKKNAPCLIFIDELDAIGRSRYGISEGAHSQEQTLNALLVEMDGFEANTGVIVLAATNRPDVLDKALLRPGRFDRQITIDLPDLRGRLGILKIHANHICLNPSVDLRVIARGTAGFSGADLANLINEAALLATRTGKSDVGLAELEEARDKVCWGKERRSRRITDRERMLIAYHEGGHALVNMLCEHTTPLHKITIIPRGIAYLGATMQLPEQDRYTVAYSELLDEIAVTMGGRIAEQLIFNEVSSGASADIRQATNTARRMVCSYGMSALGPIDYANSEGVSFLGREMRTGQANSEATDREVDLAIREIILAAEERVRKLLTENLDKLKQLAEALLERETMTAEEVYTLLGMTMPESKISADDFDEGEDGKIHPEQTNSEPNAAAADGGEPTPSDDGAVESKEPSAEDTP